ncbi:MAG: ABC-ATPase UvrA, partial [Planctomycetota bacterium]
LPLTAGAMDGTRVGRYLAEPDGQFIATLRAAAPEVDWDRPWESLSEAERALALEGGDGATLTVRWQLAGAKRTGEGKDAHEFEAKWDGFLALAEREAARRARQKSAAQWAEPLVDVPCEACGGARLNTTSRTVRVGDLTLPAALDLPLDGLVVALESLTVDGAAAAAMEALLPEIRERVDDLRALGLGHLTLARASRTLSAGELQRVRLASVLRSGLTGVTLVLDEPTLGLHARDVDGLVVLLRGYRDRGNTVVVVEHEPRVLRAADHLVELGPRAGAEGGRIVDAGAPLDVLAGDGPTAMALRTAPPPSHRPPSDARLVLRGCRAHHLKGIDVDLPLSGVVAVTGVSGSGKSSLLFDVLEASVRAQRPVECDAIEVDGGPERFKDVRTTRWITGATTVLTALDGMAAMQKLFHAEAKGTGLARSAFSFASPAGRCPACGGTGRERVAMDFMADLELVCSVCEGRRYRDEVLAVIWNGMNVAESLERPVSDLVPLLPKGKLRAAFEALERVGLGALTPGRRTHDLSGGEVQRVTLAASLAASASPTLHLYDEPATGLHEADVARLADVLHALADRGDLVVVAEHRLSLIARADHVVDLGPESGASGGTVVDSGAPAQLTRGATARELARRPTVSRTADGA